MSRRRISIKTAIVRHVPRHARLLVAVSGGRDSVVLLHALARSQPELQLHIEVGHVDHELRDSSADDAKFVATWCAQLGLPCHVRKVTQRARGENLESWARRERYAALTQVRKERQLDFLLTAHTANDVAETLLMRLLARKELTSIDDMDHRRCVLRPFLEIGRGQIDDYVAAFQVPFVEDESNADTRFVRNRVRHELLPLLSEQFDPSIVWILSEQARSLAHDSEAVRAWASKLIDGLGALREGDSLWAEQCQQVLKTVPHAVRWRVVQGLCVPRFGFSIGETKACAILRVLSGEASSIEVERGIFLRRTSEGIVIDRGKD